MLVLLYVCDCSSFILSLRCWSLVPVGHMTVTCSCFVVFLTVLILRVCWYCLMALSPPCLLSLWVSQLFSLILLSLTFPLIHSVPHPPGFATANLCPQAKQGHSKGNSELNGYSWLDMLKFIVCLTVGSRCSGGGIIHTALLPPSCPSTSKPTLLSSLSFPTYLSISLNRPVTHTLAVLYH
jgi:hypothetical protein